MSPTLRPLIFCKDCDNISEFILEDAMSVSEAESPASLSGEGEKELTTTGRIVSSELHSRSTTVANVWRYWGLWD